MLTRTMLAGAGAMMMCGAASAMSAPPEAGKWSFEGTFGVEFNIGGDVHGAANAPVADVSLLDPGLPATTATLAIQSREWDEVYDEFYGLALQVNYGLSDRADVFGRLTYSTGNADALQVGNAIVDAPVSATLPIIGSFDDYEAFGIEAGARYFFPDMGGIVPYVGGAVGLQFVDEITATFTVPGTAIRLPDTAFYEETTAVSLALNVGAFVPLDDTAAIGIETGVRYQTDLEDDDSALGGLGLAAINDEGERWSVPVTVRLRYRF